MTSPGSALAALRKRATFVCEYCGNNFEARANPAPKFCKAGCRANAAKKRKGKNKMV